VECPRQYADWCLQKFGEAVTRFIIRFKKSFSSIFEIVLRFEIGRQFDGLLGSRPSPFSSGVMEAVCIVLGKHCHGKRGLRVLCEWSKHINTTFVVRCGNVVLWRGIHWQAIINFVTSATVGGGRSAKCAPLLCNGFWYPVRAALASNGVLIFCILDCEKSENDWHLWIQSDSGTISLTFAVCKTSRITD